jgi:translation initiation factor 4E
MNGVSRQNYSQNLVPISTFDTVEQFWAAYSYLVQPSELPNSTDVHLFKAGIVPLWEDEANRNGCHFKIFMRKQISARLWENLILAILGEQFMISEEICGAVLSIRKQDTISVWLRTTDPDIVRNAQMTFFRILNLPVNTFVIFKLHTEKLSTKEEEEQ